MSHSYVLVSHLNKTLSKIITVGTLYPSSFDASGFFFYVVAIYFSVAISHQKIAILLGSNISSDNFKTKTAADTNYADDIMNLRFIAPSRNIALSVN